MIPLPQPSRRSWRPQGPRGWILAFALAAAVLYGGAFLLTSTMVAAGGMYSLPFEESAAACQAGGANQPPPSSVAQGTAKGAAGGIPARYLADYQAAGKQYGIPWGVLAGIGKVETDHGRLSAPGVSSGTNSAGAGGPMQFEASTWATYGDGKPADLYNPDAAIPAAARLLVASGAPGNIRQAIYAYNHAGWYVNEVLSYASQYSSGGYAVTTANKDNGQTCASDMASRTATGKAAIAISYAQKQIGKPYVWGATGPAAFDCSGLMFAAYRQAGVTIPRSSQAQWAGLPHVPSGQEQPGDLVFFAGSDGTPTAPGHVGLVIGNGWMIEAYATGTPVRAISYRSKYPAGPFIGFARPR